MAGTGAQVCVRTGNFPVRNDRMRLYGVRFFVTGGDGGRWPCSQGRSETTGGVGMRQMPGIEFLAAPGAVAFPCPMSRHTMGPMGHGIPNTLGVEQRIRRFLPGCMAMGHMPGPGNTLAMMAGKGPIGNIEMAGLFTVGKVRDDLAPGDYRDPGWYRHPPGEVASRISSDPDFGQPARRGTVATLASDHLPTPRRDGHPDH